MSERTTDPYYHVEMHTVEGEKYKVTIKVNQFGFRELIIQNVNKRKVVGMKEDKKAKATWLRDWSNYK